MRITNGIMISNSLANINKNKERQNTLNTQLMTQQKIQRPSEDPIIAVRALRLRTTYSEICQYLEKNIPDADNWMSTTDKAMESIEGVLGDILEYLNEGANGYLQDTDKQTISNTLKTYRDQLFADANADYAGRKLFTGYKTDKSLTFTEDEKDTSFEIKEKFEFADIRDEKRVANGIDISKVSANTIGTLNINSIAVPEYKQVYSYRLGYDNIDAAAGDTLSINLSEKQADGTMAVKDTIDVKVVSRNDTNALEPADGEVYLIKETGELIMGKDAYAQMENADQMDITYKRTGFKKGELNPIHYFDCTDITDPAKPVTYTEKDQPISYEVSFNQSIDINVQGKDVFKHAMTRDVDEILSIVDYAIESDNKVNKIKELYEKEPDGTANKTKLKELLDMAQRENDYATEKLNDAFTSGLTKFQNHKTTVGNARADIGARQQRLELTQTRLSAQKTTVKNLKSTNEEVNVTDVAVEYAEAKSVYDASLAAAAKIVQKRLLDFL